MALTTSVRALVAVVAVVALVMAAAAATTPARAFTVADCKPRARMQLATCTRLRRFCALNNIAMGWVGTGCADDNGRNTDGGCQCGNPNECVGLCLGSLGSDTCRDKTDAT